MHARDVRFFRTRSYVKRHRLNFELTVLQDASCRRGCKNRVHNAQYQAIPVLEEDGRDYKTHLWAARVSSFHPAILWWVQHGDNINNNTNVNEVLNGLVFEYVPGGLLSENIALANYIEEWTESVAGRTCITWRLDIDMLTFSPKQLAGASHRSAALYPFQECDTRRLWLSQFLGPKGWVAGIERLRRLCDWRLNGPGWLCKSLPTPMRSIRKTRDCHHQRWHFRSRFCPVRNLYRLEAFCRYTQAEISKSGRSAGSEDANSDPKMLELRIRNCRGSAARYPRYFSRVFNLVEMKLTNQYVDQGGHSSTSAGYAFCYILSVFRLLQ